MKIICDDKIPYINGILEPYAEIVYKSGKEIDRALVRDADALITRTRTICDRNLLEGSSVKAIASATIGYDHIDTKWCEANGIIWANAPGCNSGSVCQYIASALCVLALRYKLRFEELTLGIVGVGNVGGKVARMASLLGMKVLLNDPLRDKKELSFDFVSLDEIIAGSDIITLHVPLSKDGKYPTYHLFDSKRLASMRPEQLLINSSRGAVVDNAALRCALASNKIRGAVIDVWEGEPDLDLELMRLCDIATPHIAGYSADGKANASESSVRSIADWLDLPLKDWKTGNIPKPVQPSEFSLSAKGKSTQDLFIEALLYCYDILSDDALLRNRPEDFEKLRESYPVRREPEAFCVKTDSAAAAEILSALGFKTAII